MSDSLPPLSVDELKEILKNPNFKTYLVLGKAADKAWKLGLAAQNMLAGMRAYLVKPDAQSDVRSAFGVSSGQIGVVFGRSTRVKKKLTKKQAEDFLTVVDSINNA